MRRSTFGQWPSARSVREFGPAGWDDRAAGPVAQPTDGDPTVSGPVCVDVGGDLRGPVRSWRQLLFPAVFLVSLVQTGSGVWRHSHGVGIAVGLAVLAVFC